ncbi:hypothetical protein N658DRAFT_497483 [Parathielavia hyrcaniae]|uniref:Uncharacterized protein n=1 Tax=Parathielavia hyrcaniae TaxID=113614 RepID=A0AAN6Q3F0_9PEZI|nr:hypothetical protein N658DRAFT_497483 [Parathielavia hyrcaniae]
MLLASFFFLPSFLCFLFFFFTWSTEQTLSLFPFASLLPRPQPKTNLGISNSPAQLLCTANGTRWAQS